MFQTIQDHRITVLTMLPTAYRKMLALPDAEQYDLSSLRLCTGGGESLTADTFHRWRERFGMEIHEGFGTTEMMYVFISNAVAREARPGSIGWPVPGYEIQVVDEQGESLPPGEPGRLIVRGPTGTLYWRDVDRQRTVVRDGWNVVGDYMRRDDDGYVWFVSREDDLIKSSGYRIGPEEVEQALVKHPAVLDAAVVGVPDPIRGQNAKAFVVLRPDSVASEELKEDILRFLRSEIAVYKLPRLVDFVDELPRSPTGKLLRRVLREREASPSAPAS
jgi:2-aminobenzoate-CoA ligase